MSTATTLHTRLLAQVRAAAVATAAGVASGTWSAADYPRVFIGDAGWIGHRNRGRLPFVELFVGPQAFDRTSVESGTNTVPVTLRVHAGGSGVQSAEEQTYAILAAAMSSIRSQSVDNYTNQGDGDVIGPMQPGPWGHVRDAELVLAFTYLRTDYGE